MGWVGYCVPVGGLGRILSNGGGQIFKNVGEVGRILCTGSDSMYLKVGLVEYYVPGHRKVSPWKSSNFHG